MKRALPAALLLLALQSGPHPAEAGEPSPAPASISLAERYRQALAVDPDNLPLHYYLGISELVEGNAAAAIAELRLAYPAFAESVEIHYNLGLAYQQVGDLDSALIYLERSEELGALGQQDIYPLANAYYNLALGYLDQGADADAERLLQRVLGIDPERFEARRLLGDLYARAGAVDRALEEFDRLLLAYPQDQAARDYLHALSCNRGLELMESGDAAGARALFLKASETLPQNTLADYYLGYLDFSEGQVDSAVRRLLAAFPRADGEVRAGIRSLLHNSALALLKQRKARRALDAIEPLVNAPAPDVDDLNLSGNIHLALGEFERAHAAYRKVLEIDPSHRDASLNLVAVQARAIEELLRRGRQHAAAGQLLAAAAAYQEVLAINPAAPRALAALADTRDLIAQRAAGHFSSARDILDTGRHRQALQEIQQGLALQPGSPTGLALRDEAAGALDKDISGALKDADESLAAGALADAESAFDRVLQISPDHPRAVEGKARLSAMRRQQIDEALAAGRKALSEGDFPSARQAFETALALRPDLPQALAGLEDLESQLSQAVSRALGLARQARSAGRLAEARTHFEQALRLRDDPDVRGEIAEMEKARNQKIEGLLTLADEALAREEFKQADGLYRKVLGQAPGHPQAADGLARTERLRGDRTATLLGAARKHLAQGRLQEALEGFRRVLDLAPGNPTALDGIEQGRQLLQGELARLVEQGRAALKAGDLPAAEEGFRKALDLDPYLGSAKEGLEHIARLQKSGIAPGDEQRLYLRGIELYTRGKYEEAVAAWQQVLMLDPDHDKAKRNIEKAQRKLRQIQEYRNG